MDTTFTALQRDTEGFAWASLRHPDGQRSVDLWVDEHYGYLVCFTGDTLPDDARRRGVAIEPMSCPPDALRSGTDLVVLESGQYWLATWGLQPR
jgi:aldose 1-epimerase